MGATPTFGGDLWGLTCHFNPGRYAQRLANHRRFRERLGLPLLAVELSHDGEFELRDDDADHVLRLATDTVLWHKERLLNLGVAALPPTCDQVAWLDGDVLFERDDWQAETRRRLREDSHPAVMLQLFDRFTDLPRGQHDPAGAGPESWLSQGRSFVSLAAEGGHERELFDELWGNHAVPAGGAGREVRRTRNSGLAWAARRELLTRHGLYDACILGSGDRAIVCAAYGRAGDAAQNFVRNAAQREHYLAWAEPFARAVGGRIGFVEGRLFHLWHGDLADRGYRERWAGFAAHDFDPHTDLALDAKGCWRWNSEKPDMHAYVRDYFARRREDGPCAERAG